jgi:hypothetical protein
LDITIVRQNTIVRHPSETFDNGRIDLAEYPDVIITGGDVTITGGTPDVTITVEARGT